MRPGGTAIEEAYRRDAPLLVAVARRVLADPADAEDCVHEVIARLLADPGAYRPERGALRAFLVVCVRNEALSRRRAALRHGAIEARAAASPDALRDERIEAADPIERARLGAALRALPAEQRAVIGLAYFGGRTQREIAAALGLPLGTVKSRAALALRKLAHALATGAR